MSEGMVMIALANVASVGWSHHLLATEDRVKAPSWM